MKLHFIRRPGYAETFANAAALDYSHTAGATGSIPVRPTKQYMAQLARWHGEGKLKPHVSQTLPLAKAADALKLMATRQVKGKLVPTSG